MRLCVVTTPASSICRLFWISIACCGSGVGFLPFNTPRTHTVLSRCSYKVRTAKSNKHYDRMSFLACYCATPYRAGIAPPDSSYSITAELLDTAGLSGSEFLDVLRRARNTTSILAFSSCQQYLKKAGGYYKRGSQESPTHCNVRNHTRRDKAQDTWEHVQRLEETAKCRNAMQAAVTATDVDVSRKHLFRLFRNHLRHNSACTWGTFHTVLMS